MLPYGGVVLRQRPDDRGCPASAPGSRIRPIRTAAVSRTRGGGGEAGAPAAGRAGWRIWWMRASAVAGMVVTPYSWMVGFVRDQSETSSEASDMLVIRTATMAPR
jgi:hypothetical protein